MVELFNLYFTKKVIKQYKDKNLTSKVNVLVCYKIDLVVEWRKGEKLNFELCLTIYSLGHYCEFHFHFM